MMLRCNIEPYGVFSLKEHCIEPYGEIHTGVWVSVRLSIVQPFYSDGGEDDSDNKCGRLWRGDPCET